MSKTRNAQSQCKLCIVKISSTLTLDLSGLHFAQSHVVNCGELATTEPCRKGKIIPLPSGEWAILSHEQAGLTSPTLACSAIRNSIAASVSPWTSCKTCPYSLPTAIIPNQNSSCQLSPHYCLKYPFTPPGNILAMPTYSFDAVK